MSSVSGDRIRFAGFEFDPFNARLVHGDEIIPMRPKTVALLVELTARPGDLVGKDKLMSTVWPEAVVTDSVLAGAVQELRRLLGDDPRRPHVIETVHRRGYRFIAPIAQRSGPATKSPAPAPRIEQTSVIGRSAELEILTSWLAAATGGQGVLGFVVGEAGIGKTTLTRAFCERAAAADPALRVGTGHGIEWTSQVDAAVDPYLPVIEALSRACTGPGSERTIETLRRYAPSWLVLLPGIDSGNEGGAAALRTTRERLALELAGFLDALPHPLLLILEDLHWSDASTLDLLTAVARRPLRAPLLILATYRAAGAAARKHPVRAAHQTLSARGLCRDLWVKPFGADEVRDCVARRWPAIPPAKAADVARIVLQKTDGNPLFVTNVVEQLDAERLATAESFANAAAELGVGIPAGLRQMIDGLMGRLDTADREVLEAGSLCGPRFSAEVVAAALATDVLAVETRLDALAETGVAIRQSGEEIFPDGTTAAMYEFVHALYGDVLRSSVSPAGRRRSHRRIADRLLSAWRGKEEAIAADLAFHFHAAGAPDEAVPHAQRAATAALLLGGHREAGVLLERTLDALATLPPTPERQRSAMNLAMALGQSLQAPDGFNAPAAEAAYVRALGFAESLDEPLAPVIPLLALTSVRVAQGRVADARKDADRVTSLLERFPSPPLQFLADAIIAQVCHHQVELAEARQLLERAIAYRGEPAIVTFVDFRIHALNYLSLTLMQLGCPDSARRCNREAMAATKEAGRPFDRASAAAFACFAGMQVRDRVLLEVASADAETIGREYGYGFPAVMGVFTRGLVARLDGDVAGGIETMMGAIRIFEQYGNTLIVPSLMNVVADAHLTLGDAAAARSLCAESRVYIDKNGDNRFVAEFTRIEAAADLLDGDAAKARAGFESAISLAQSLGVRWQELRASLALARLLESERDFAGARRALEPIVTAIKEGSDLEELRDAQLLLRALEAA